MAAGCAGIERDIPTAADIHAGHGYVAQAPRTVDDDGPFGTKGDGWSWMGEMGSMTRHDPASSSFGGTYLPTAGVPRDADMHGVTKSGSLPDSSRAIPPHARASSEQSRGDRGEDPCVAVLGRPGADRAEAVLQENGYSTHRTRSTLNDDRPRSFVGANWPGKWAIGLQFSSDSAGGNAGDSE